MKEIFCLNPYSKQTIKGPCLYCRERGNKGRLAQLDKFLPDKFTCTTCGFQVVFHMSVGQWRYWLKRLNPNPNHTNKK